MGIITSIAAHIFFSILTSLSQVTLSVKLPINLFQYVQIILATGSNKGFRLYPPLSTSHNKSL